MLEPLDYVRFALTLFSILDPFAAIPLFLLWVYFSWLVTLSAALIPSTLGRGAAR